MKRGVLGALPVPPGLVLGGRPLNSLWQSGRAAAQISPDWHRQDGIGTTTFSSICRWSMGHWGLPRNLAGAERGKRMEDIARNIDRVREGIARAAARSGRDPAGITLIAVTKNVPAEQINVAIKAGVKNIGENRVQEAVAKFDAVTAPVKWHFIGHLQRNKVKQVLGRFDLIHSLDRLSLAREIQKRAAALGILVPCLVEVNVGGEESKFGIKPDDLSSFLREVAGFPNIKICGLMTIAPFSPNPEAARPVFRRLLELYDRGGYPPGVTMEYLSMGMSGDYVVAVEEGANMVRIGTAIFGPRRKPEREG